MRTKSIGFFFIIILIAAAGLMSWRMYLKHYTQSDSLNIHRFPKEINGWTSEELPVTDEEKAILETDNVFVRRYSDSEGREVFLFVVYSENNRKVSHPPEICYTGGGATIMSSDKDFIDESQDVIIPVNRLKIELGHKEQIFVYWFKVGDSFTSNYWKQQAMIASKALFGQRSSSALIRISTIIRKGDDDQAIETIKEFGKLSIPLLRQYLL